MQYLALLYSAEEARPTPASSNFQETLQAYATANRTFQESGVWAGAEPLQPVATAKCLRIRNGERLVTDGPFAETKERLGGFYLLNCKDLDHAIELAKMIPAVEYGTIELRPILEIPDTGSLRDGQRP